MRMSQLLMESLDRLLDTLTPPGLSPALRQQVRLAAHHLGHIEHSTRPFVMKYGLLVEIDGVSGVITRSWHSPDGTVPTVSEGHLHEDGYVYVGSPQNPFVARLKYNQV